ncbi:hypothetical protein N7471_010275 [Penicillium samsonianum]|uniref:uncharacterized protein n=1 Tax=Penicillium samsonianum TaxID=1882272 RepID=UPI00254711A9|nr:uncharacterized protein N7471_010275 [Penicillium samsonianum]KAJ6125782.1 hypothetical protein N7471_010275 [Penicillium samsonianum]
MCSASKRLPTSTQWEALLPAHYRRHLYTGISARGPDPVDGSSQPPTINLCPDAVSDEGTLQTYFDIDSAGGLARSLAGARGGIQ